MQTSACTPQTTAMEDRTVFVPDHRGPGILPCIVSLHTGSVPITDFMTAFV
jgi:hypothetical protein